MTKKQFIVLADALRAVKPHPVSGAAAKAQWDVDVRAVALACAAQNPRFNRDRWFDYVEGKCGPNGGALPAGTQQ